METFKNNFVIKKESAFKSNELTNAPRYNIVLIHL